MNSNSDSRYTTLYKPAMLGVLVLGVVIAGILVSKSRTTEYSPPIKLEGMGVSVSVPSGSQWQRPSAGWQYEKNAFSLSAVLQLSSQSAISAQWKYQLLPIPGDIDTLFAKKAQSIFGELTISDTQKIGNSVLYTAKIVSEKKQAIVYLAVLQRPIGHLLTLEVVQRAATKGMASDVFDKLIETMKCADSDGLKNGSELVADFKANGLWRIPKAQQGLRYYFIRNTDQQITGFVLGGLTDSGKASDSQPIVAVSLYYMDSPASAFSEQSVIKTDTTLDKFEWLTRQSDLRAKREVAIKLQHDPNGIISIELVSAVKLGDFLPSKVAVPDILFDQFVVMFAQENYQNAFVDVVLVNGQVIPAVLSVLPAATSEYKYVVQVKFNDDKNRSQKMYIDFVGEIGRIEVDAESDYTVEAASADDVIAQFAQWTPQIEFTQQQLAVPLE